ncbi:MAG: Acetylornithine/succinyldiaminopimelate aminotransferase [Chlamydiales bacterium]|nr:Acetylornithine/succinyldiaminopimelate aminotransferase [Chlamydiales bacterium]MCH9634945.1 Acetylornithine/succinyldiaminopimelate aminotransferase [Chlamydiales bacterium]MCH9703424.1 aminotransferase class III-fold pyridoxal phosphate-dependent enzyme [Chlamydiota bacterium]
MTLIADAIQNCPEIIKAKAKILKQVSKYNGRLTGVAPAKNEEKVCYSEILAAMTEHRGQNLFFPLIGSGAGNGALVELADGSVKYDCINGIGVHFGHGHPALIEASLDAALQNIPMQGNLMQNRDSVALCELILKASGMAHCLLTTSGAMANENALKLLFQKKAPAHRILAFEGCFMGRTLALSSITDKPHYREGLPAHLHVDYIPFYDWKKPQKSVRRALKTLEIFLSRHPGKYAGMCMELIQGENGFYPGSNEFFLGLAKMLKEADIPLLVDEVQTFGRTTHPFAFQHYGLEEYVDVVCMGKLSQVCATLFSKEFKPKPGLLSQTFTSSTSAIRCSHVILDNLLNDGYFGINGRNMQLRKQFVDNLKAIEERHGDLLTGPYGSGMMIACTPYGGDHARVIDLIHRLFDAGLITFLAGKNPTRLRFLLPAGGIRAEDIDVITAIFEECLTA